MNFTKTHEWISQIGPIYGSEKPKSFTTRSIEKVYTVGVTKHARNEIGEIACVEFPKVGSFVKAGDDACVIESTKAAVVIHSPVSGKIVAINEELKSNIDLINRDPEKEGWLYQIEMTEPRELEGLLSPLDYDRLVRPLGFMREPI